MTSKGAEPSGLLASCETLVVHSPRGRYTSCGIHPLRTLSRPDTSGSNRPKPQRNLLHDKSLKQVQRRFTWSVITHVRMRCSNTLAFWRALLNREVFFRKLLQACRGSRSPCRGRRRCPAPQLLGQIHHLQGGRRSLCKPSRCG